MNGDSLDIKNNQQSEIDIKSIVEGNEQSRLIFTGTGATLSVTINYGNMSVADKATLLDNNPGLKLIDDLVSSNKNFLYEATEVAQIKDDKGNRTVELLFADDNGCINSSNNGLDADGKLTYQPTDGYDEQVPVASKGSWTTTSGGVRLRKSMVFHELSENYERTQWVYKYSKAQDLLVSGKTMASGLGNRKAQVTLGRLQVLIHIKPSILNFKK